MSYHSIVIDLTETWIKLNQNSPYNNLQKYAFYSTSLTQTKGGGDGLYVRSSTIRIGNVEIFQGLMRGATKLFLWKY